jgi:hypothetical protein
MQTMNRVELAPLLSAWRTRNARNGITGVLLLKNADFMQYLEGPEPALTLLYAHICVDPRHTGIVELLRESVARREFPDWPMACFAVPTRHAIPRQPPDEAVRRLLDPHAAQMSAARSLIESFWDAGGPSAAP